MDKQLYMLYRYLELVLSATLIFQVLTPKIKCIYNYFASYENRTVLKDLFTFTAVDSLVLVLYMGHGTDLQNFSFPFYVLSLFSCDNVDGRTLSFVVLGQIVT